MALDAPMTQSMLKMPDPMMLPTAMSVSPFLAAITDAQSSGRLVPIDTTVSAMIRSICDASIPRTEPSAIASSVVPDTSMSDPHTMAASEMATVSKAFHMGMAAAAVWGCAPLLRFFSNASLRASPAL